METCSTAAGHDKRQNSKREHGDRKDSSEFEYTPLDLSSLRLQLVRLEDTIIYLFIERAQFKQNPSAQDPKALKILGAGGASQFQGSYFSYYLTECEKVHAKMRRYTSPDEHPFTPYEFLPKPILPALKWPKTLREDNGKWSINDKILDFYMNVIVKNLCEEGEDHHFGSSVTLDVELLQALSKRIHYGKFVAEIKFRKNRKRMSRLIRKADIEGIRKEITKAEVEAKILQRVSKKALAYGNPDVLSVIDDEDTSSIDGTGSTKISRRSSASIDLTHCKIEPKTIAKLYEEIMELTKQVQLKYLLERPLDDD